MSVFDRVTRTAGRVAEDVQHRVRRARLEGERRVLARQQRAALEELGRRTWELSQDDRLPADLLAPEIARIEAKQMELDAKSIEIDALADPDDG